VSKPLVFIIVIIASSFIGLTQQEPVEKIEREIKGVIAEAKRLKGLGKNTEALALFKKALELQEKKLGKFHDNTPLLLSFLADQYDHMELHAKAEPLRIKSILISRRNFGAEHWITVAGLNTLANHYEKTKKYQNAEKLYLLGLKLNTKARGEIHEDTAQSASYLGFLYEQMADYKKAEKYLLISLELKEKIHGAKAIELAFGLGNLGSLYRDLGRCREAERIYLRCLGILEAGHGKDSIETAKTSNELAIVYDRMNEYAQSDKLYSRSLTIAEAKYGRNHIALVDFLDDWGRSYIAQGKYVKAEEVLMRGLRINEKEFGAGHPSVLSLLEDLASLYGETGRYGESEAVLQNILKINKAHPERFNDFSVSRTLGNLGLLYQSMGNLKESEEFLKKSHDMAVTLLGKNHPDIATSLNNFGVLYQMKGELKEAERYFSKSLAAKKSIFGDDHPETAGAMVNIAELYRSIGDFSSAEKSLSTALGICRRKLGDGHPNTSKCLNNLAVVQTSMGKYQEALKHLDASIAVTRLSLGEKHPEHALSLANQASLYLMMGDYRKSISIIDNLLKIHVENFGENNPRAALLLSNLAWANLMMEDYREAEQLLHRCLRIYNNSVTKEHPERIKNLAAMSMAQLSAKKSDSAINYARQATAGRKELLRTVLSFASENQRLEFQRTQRSDSMMYTLADGPELADLVLCTKGIVLASLLEDRLTTQTSSKPATKERVSRMMVAKRRLNKLRLEINKNRSPKGLKQAQKELITVKNEVDQIQKELAVKLTGYGMARRSLSIKAKDVQSVLPEGQTLIEYVQYEQYMGKNRFEPHYGAIVILPQKKPIWLRLNSVDVIDNLLARSTPSNQVSGKAFEEILRELYDKLVAPILKVIPRGTQTLILSPDGRLNFLSFATVLTEKNRFLCEDYSIKYVSSGRDLLSTKKTQPSKADLLVFANPSFNEKPEGMASTKGGAVNLSSLERDELRGTLKFNALLGTQKEADYLESHAEGWMLQPKVYSEQRATEAAINDIHSPHILHLATHGFFLAEEKPKEQVQLNNLMQGSNGQKKYPGLARNPMYRSGLALAGAQKTLDAWAKDEVPPTETDGILTAAEASLLDLEDTWLVTLSACKTGRGEARAGEGVLGLRRAFIQSGAQNLMMTLWPVSDKYTADFIKSFYDRAMINGDAPQALADVQRDLLVKHREKFKDSKSATRLAVQLAGPFILSFQGKP
jgi:CHAT domain-containing protein